MESQFVSGWPSGDEVSMRDALTEGMSELTFGRSPAGDRIAMSDPGNALRSMPAPSSALREIIPKQQLPEGPFGDNLGYYSRATIPCASPNMCTIRRARLARVLRSSVGQRGDMPVAS